jgi:hypothetical protein
MIDEAARRLWAEAERAIEEHRPDRALRWPAQARDQSGALDGPIVAAELLATEAKCWAALDELREAIGPALAAWKHWLTVANGPTAELIVSPARVLLTVLPSRTRLRG